MATNGNIGKIKVARKGNEINRIHKSLFLVLNKDCNRSLEFSPEMEAKTKYAQNIISS